MSYQIRASIEFQRRIKKLLKKYSSLADELKELIGALIDNPREGKSLGRNCYKVRLAIGSKGKRRSGGARVITYVAVMKEEVFLLTIYDKAEKDSLRPSEL